MNGRIRFAADTAIGVFTIIQIGYAVGQDYYKTGFQTFIFLFLRLISICILCHQSSDGDPFGDPDIPRCPQCRCCIGGCIEDQNGRMICPQCGQVDPELMISPIRRYKY